MNAKVQISNEDLMIRIGELEARIEQLENSRKRVKGERQMTDEDAKSIMKGGKHQALSHGAAAKELNLSYGQVYSCRFGHTFRNLKLEWSKDLVK